MRQQHSFTFATLVLSAITIKTSLTNDESFSSAMWIYVCTNMPCGHMDLNLKLNILFLPFCRSRQVKNETQCYPITFFVLFPLTWERNNELQQGNGCLVIWKYWLIKRGNDRKKKIIWIFKCVSVTVQVPLVSIETVDASQWRFIFGKGIIWIHV